MARIGSINGPMSTYAAGADRRLGRPPGNHPRQPATEPYHDAGLHPYRIGQHVAASLALFAAVALLFWYVLRLVMSMSSRD